MVLFDSQIMGSNDTLRDVRYSNRRCSLLHRSGVLNTTLIIIVIVGF